MARAYGIEAEPTTAERPEPCPTEHRARFDRRRDMRTLSLHPRVPVRFRSALLIGALATLALVALAACSSGGSTPTPEPSASPTPDTVTGADEAVELVLAQDPRFERIRPYDPDLIGQAAWTKVQPSAGGWTVAVRIGWGDCPSGCIDEHTWTYEITTAGEVTLVDEQGPAVPENVFDVP